MFNRMIVLVAYKYHTLIGISISICLIMAIVSALVAAGTYCVEGLPKALLIKLISKKKRSLFDLYKAVVRVF